MNCWWRSKRCTTSTAICRKSSDRISAPKPARALLGLVEAGINEWGGISPVTADHVNPEAPWPDIVKLRSAPEQSGMALQQRLAIYPAYATNPFNLVAR